jgi:hypothetical protein
MKVYTNERYIKRRAAIGKGASLLGLLVLGGGLIVSFRDPRLFFISFGALLLGFLFSNVGIYYANRYARPDRPDVALVQALKGFDKRFALYQFLLPVSHVLREPGGLTVLVPKPQEGQIVYQNGKWRNKQGWQRIFRWVGQEGLGKPEMELEGETQTMRDWLQKQAPDLEVPVRGVLVFTNPNAELALEAPAVPTMAPKQLKGWLRKAGKLSPLPAELQAQLTEVLNEATHVTEDESEE